MFSLLQTLTKKEQVIANHSYTALRKLLACPQAAQTHYMNADVTLACERCCVTNGYLQRLVWDRSVFLKRDKNVMFLNKIDVPYCLVVFFVVYPRLRPF